MYTGLLSPWMSLGWRQANEVSVSIWRQQHCFQPSRPGEKGKHTGKWIVNMADIPLNDHRIQAAAVREAGIAAAWVGPKFWAGHYRHQARTLDASVGETWLSLADVARTLQALRTSWLCVTGRPCLGLWFRPALPFK